MHTIKESFFLHYGSACPNGSLSSTEREPSHQQQLHYSRTHHKRLLFTTDHTMDGRLTVPTMRNARRGAAEPTSSFDLSPTAMIIALHLTSRRLNSAAAAGCEENRSGIKTQTYV